jgi:hypothetical protein
MASQAISPFGGNPFFGNPFCRNSVTVGREKQQQKIISPVCVSVILIFVTNIYFTLLLK